MAVRIVTDSAADIRPALADELGIVTVPLTIRFGDDEYTDGVDLTPEAFYEELAASTDLPETAAPAPGAFEQAFAALVDDGADAIVCINLSSELSATMQSASTAAKSMDPRADVRVLDSKSITAGEGTIVVEAAKAAMDGQSVDQVVVLAESLRDRTRVYGALDTLEHLKKGGRIGGAQAFLGSVLSIKPCVDISSGVVQEAGKPRTRRKSLQWLREKVNSDGAVESLSVMHANAVDVDEMVDLLAETFARESIHVDLIGPVIGTHGGPGTVGLCYLAPD